MRRSNAGYIALLNRKLKIDAETGDVVSMKIRVVKMSGNRFTLRKKSVTPGCNEFRSFIGFPRLSKFKTNVFINNF